MFLIKLANRTQDIFAKSIAGVIGIIFICGITFALYFPSLFLDFLELSDQNLWRKNYEFEYAIWSNEPNSITFLSFALNRHLTGFSAFALRLTSLLIHLFNTILVYRFTYHFLCLRKRRYNHASESRIIALFTAFFFGIHPLNSEAVTWISARESLVFGCLFFSVLNLWVIYVKTKNWFVYSIVILMISALFYEQPVAVILLPILVCIDWFLNRKYQRKPKRILEKIPIVLWTIYVFVRYFFNPSTIRQIQENIQITIESYSFFDPAQFQFFNKAILGCYALGSYILKTVFPFFISGYYPYPVFPNENISPEYQLFILLIVSILLSFPYLIRYKLKEILFGISFMFLAISPFMPCYHFSGKLMQDAYYYTAIYGIILAIVCISHQIAQKKDSFKTFIILGVLVLSGLYVIKTLSLHIYRYDEFSLRNHNVAVYPESEEVRQKRLEMYIHQGNKNEALNDLNFILEKRQIPKFYVLRGDILFQMKQFQKACQDYQKAEELLPNSPGDRIKKNCTKMIPKMDESQ